MFPDSPEIGQFRRYVKVVETGETLDIEAHYTGILPGDPWLRMVAVPRADGFAIAFTDITAFKNAEKALKEQAAIIAQMHESVITVDLDGNVTGWNDGAAKLFGYRSEEIIGRHYIALLEEENIDAVRSLIEDPILEKGRHEIEIALRRKSGEIFTGHVLSSILHDEDGKPSGMVGYTLDVTERKAAEEALKTAYAEMETRVENRTRDLKTELVRGQRTQVELEKAKVLAEEASRAKSDFLSRENHELRTPMNAILGFSQLFQHDTKSPLTGDQPQYVHEIMSAGDHLMMLVSQLLDMSKIETGNMGLSLTSTPAAPLIEECLAMTQSLADAHGITLLKCAENDGLPEIKTDPLRFKQILLNLMSNAIKYNRDDGEVVIDCQKIPGAYLRISVTDQGPGIPADQFDNVFEPFNRAGAEYAEVPGTGIGLAIAKQMVELMGDEIGLESKVGEGTTFWFTAPVAAETASSVST